MIRYAVLVLLAAGAASCDAKWEDGFVLTCNACLRAEPEKCASASSNWESYLSDMGRDNLEYSAAMRVCELGLSVSEWDELAEPCATWAIRERKKRFDIQCTSKTERRKSGWNFAGRI